MIAAVVKVELYLVGDRQLEEILFLVDVEELIGYSNLVFKILEKFMFEDTVIVWEMVDEFIFSLACQLHYFEWLRDFQ